MTKTTKLAEYEKGYDLITDGELNELFIIYTDDLKIAVIKDQKPCTYYGSIFFDNTTHKLNYGSHAITGFDKNEKSPAKLAKAGSKSADDFVKKYPAKTPIISILCLAGEWIDPKSKESFKSLLVVGQTADGRSCMARYKIVFDNNKIAGFDTMDEHIPKKHVDDDEYTWDGCVNFFERVAEINKKHSY